MRLKGQLVALQESADAGDFPIVIFHLTFVVANCLLRNE